MSKNTKEIENELQSKLESIQEKLNSILDDDDIELGFCIFRIKNNPGEIRAEKGHFYDITRELSVVLKESHKRMMEEVGV